MRERERERGGGERQREGGGGQSDRQPDRQIDIQMTYVMQYFHFEKMF